MTRKGGSIEKAERLEKRNSIYAHSLLKGEQNIRFTQALNVTIEMDVRKVNLQSKLKTFNEYWTPKIVGELNGKQVKLAKFKGEFVMHNHEKEDELFYVIEGKLFIELVNNTLELNAGEFVIIPKGMDHKPYAPDEVSVLLFEPVSTLNTGNTKNEMTATKLDII